MTALPPPLPLDVDPGIGWGEPLAIVALVVVGVALLLAAWRRNRR